MAAQKRTCPAKYSPDKPPSLRSIQRALALDNFVDHRPKPHRLVVWLTDSLDEFAVKVI